MTHFGKKMGLGLFLLVLFGTIHEGKGTVNSSEWQEKRTFFLGEPWTIGEYRTEFLSSPHLVVGTACPRNQTCQIPPGSRCDYSPFPLPPCEAPCNDPRVCGSLLFHWQTLEQNEPIFVEYHPQNTYQQFRLFVEDPCLAVTISMTAFNGDPDLYVSFTPPNASSSHFNVQEGNDYGDRIVICPGDWEDFNGTLYISVFAYITPAVYTIEVDFVPIPESAPALPCTPDMAPFCLQDGKPLTDSGEKTFSYQPDLANALHDPENCPIVHLEIIAPESNCTLTVQVLENGVVPDAWSFPIVLVGEFGKQSREFSICFEGESPLDDLTFLLTTWTQKPNANYTVMASTFVVATFVDMAQLPPFDAMSRLEDLLVVDCGGIYTPQYMYQNSLAWGGITGNAYNPIPPLPVLRKGVFGISYNPIWQLPHFVARRTLYTYVALNTRLGNIETVLNISSPQDCRLYHTPSIVTSRGVAISDGLTTSSPLTVTCNHEELTVLAREAREALLSQSTTNSTTGFGDELLSNLVSLDIIRYNDSWTNCERQMYAYMTETETQITNELTESSRCVIEEGGEDVEVWTEDACCNDTKCCGEYLSTSTVLALDTTLKDDFIDETCLNPECTRTYVVDFLINRNFQIEGNCTAGGLIPAPGEVMKSVQFYRSCKDFYFNSPTKNGRACRSDNDCKFVSTCEGGICTNLGRQCTTDQDCIIESSCNFFEGICSTTREDWEGMFLYCYIDGMPIENGDLVNKTFNFPPDMPMKDYFPAFKEAFSSFDCVSLYGTGTDALLFRTHTVINSISYSGFGSLECECTRVIGDVYEYCLDDLCVAPDECVYGVYNPCDVLSGLVPMNSGCDQQRGCNWHSCAGQFPEECQALCLTKQFSCGLCSDGFFTCVDLPLVTSVGECDATTVCQLPDQTYYTITSLSPDCADQGLCTGYCEGEPQCTSFGAPALCLSNSVTREECLESPLGAEWVLEDGVGFCVYKNIANAEECEKYNNIYLSCEDRDLDNCAPCEDSGNSCPLVESLLLCAISDWYPCSKGDCESPNGLCDDDVFINREVTPPKVGACLVNFTLDADYSKARRHCLFGQAFAQIGCVDYSFLTPDLCTQNDGVWTLPAKTKDECLGRGTGCRTTTTLVTGLLGQMDDCVDCGEEDTYFHWEEASWIEGQVKSPEWIETSYDVIYEVASTIDFGMLATYGEGTLTSDSLEAVQLQAFCSSSKEVIDGLDVVSCFCKPMTFSGAWTNLTHFENVTNAEREDAEAWPKCAESIEESDQTVPNTIVRFCPKREISVALAWVSLGCDGDCLSVDFCVKLELDELPSDLLAVPKSTSVTLSFVEISKQTNKYAVVINNNGATVGQVIGNGVEFIVFVELETTQSPFPIEVGKVCLTVRDSTFSDETDQYTVYDFGLENDNKKLIPFGFNLTLSTFSICSEFNVTGNNTRVYPILRYENYEDRTNERFTTAEEGVIFASAGLYLLSIMIATFLFAVPVTIQGGLVVNFAICFHCLLLYLVRGVYFFLLGFEVVPDESNENIADYILIEIPTYFYMGAFSLISNSFLFLWLRGHKGKDLSQRAFWVVFGVWTVIIYLFFIVVVVLLVTLDKGDGEPERYCSGRLVHEEEEDDNSARVIRIVYKSIVTVLASIVVGVIIGIGRVLVQETQQTVVYQSVAVSLGLLINSLAFVIYYAIDEPTPFFAIVLWFTEIVPTLMLLYMLSPRRLRAAVQRAREEEIVSTSGGSTWN